MSYNVAACLYAAVTAIQNIKACYCFIKDVGRTAPDQPRPPPILLYGNEMASDSSPTSLDED
jgi:hypothetical protein